jgi:hypothetical protein
MLRGPAKELPLGTDVVYVVGPDEMWKYAVVMLELGIPARLLCCPEQPNIAMVRRWIGARASAEGLKKFVIMDDDVGLLVRRGTDTWQLAGTTHDDAQAMLNWMEEALDSWENVGISAREGNNRAGVGGVLELSKTNTRLMRVQGFQTVAFNMCEHGRTQVMEDFDISLQILENGGSNCCSYFWAQGQAMTNAAGGCSEWRTHEVHEESAKRLRELHPGLVQLREKRNKGDADGFGTRTEVTIQWKAAYTRGQKRAEDKS